MRIRIPVLDGALCATAAVLSGYTLVTFVLASPSERLWGGSPVALSPHGSLSLFQCFAFVTVLQSRVLVYAAQRRATGARRVLGYVAAGTLAITAVSTATAGWLLPWPRFICWNFPYGLLWSSLFLLCSALVYFTSPARKKY